jgi:hypothetical protein
MEKLTALLTDKIQKLVIKNNIASAEYLKDVGLLVSESTYKEGRLSLRTDCSYLLNVNDSEGANKLCKMIDEVLFSYGYKTGDPFSDREIHLYKF